MIEWKKVKAINFIDFNPRESLQKNTMAKKVAMEQLQPFIRDISDYEIAPFNGGSKFRNGDTIMARITPCLENGKTAQINILDEGEIGFGSTEFIVLREKPGISDKNFIYYLALSPILREAAIKSMAGTSGRQRVQQGVLNDIEFYAPPLSEQIEIGNTLKGLDDKISLNNRINKTLEEMAQAIFKSWFVDFEPWGGVMPEDWYIVTIGEFADEIKNGGTPSRNNPEFWNSNDIPWIKTGEIHNCPIIQAEEYISYAGLKQSSAKLLPINSVLIALYGATAGKVGLLRFMATTNQACCAMICGSINKAIYLYQYLLINQEYIVNLSIGSAQQNLSKETISNLQIILPTEEIIKNLPFVELYDKIENNLKEIAHLAAIRDALLPKLMSGEIEIKI